MNNEANVEFGEYADKIRCSAAERDAAINFASFLYQLWIKSRKSEIIKVDKTNYDNEEPTDIN